MGLVCASIQEPLEGEGGAHFKFLSFTVLPELDDLAHVLPGAVVGVVQPLDGGAETFAHFAAAAVAAAAAAVVVVQASAGAAQRNWAKTTTSTTTTSI